MTKSFTKVSKTPNAFISLTILITGLAFHTLLSPKWVIPAAAWVAPALLLYYFNYAALRFKLGWFTIGLIVSQLIASVDVFPFPLPVIIVFTLLNTIKLLAVFLVQRWVCKKSSRFITTLAFPSAFVTKEFLDTVTGGGAWWSIANTQYGFAWMAQLSSVFGLAGITFMVYWFASVAVWCTHNYKAGTVKLRSAAWYAGSFILVMGYGAYRYNYIQPETKHNKMAGLTVPNFGLMEGIYKDVTGKVITISPSISQTSPQMQQVSAALVPFFENPDSLRFINGYKALHLLHDSLFVLSQKAVNQGASIISWSEANAIMPATMQPAFTERGQRFAKANRVYLLMAMGVFDTGKITADKMFLENKTVLVSPDGGIVNVFHKNHPVPFAEHSKPGDGKIPVIATPFGRAAVSICYDADDAASMRQLGKQGADMLFLPSGDWQAISPYHSYMAMFRGIENGCTLIRQANGGLSLVTDYRGKTQASQNFYTNGEKLWIADITIGFVPTIYAITGDVLSYLCLAATVIILLCLTLSTITKKIKAGHAVKKAALAGVA